MKSVLKLVALGLVAATVTLGACAAPTAEETDESGGAASEVAPAAAAETGRDYVASPLLGGASIKQWSVRGDTAASAEVAKLWISRDGAFTVQFPTAEPWNGSFQAESEKLTLKINNDGMDPNAAKSPVAGAWSFKLTAADTLTLSRAGSTSIVLTAVR